MKTGVNPVLVFPSLDVPSQTDLDVSIIIPTRNERENLPVLIEKLQEVMGGRRFEIVIVDDDSEDGTWQVAEEFSKRYRNIRVIRRINRKGLSSAVTEGFLLGKGKYVAVLDADYQHDQGAIELPINLLTYSPIATLRGCVGADGLTGPGQILELGSHPVVFPFQNLKANLSAGIKVPHFFKHFVSGHRRLSQFLRHKSL